MYDVIEATMEQAGNVRLDGRIRLRLTPSTRALVIVSDNIDFEDNLPRIRDYLETDLPKRPYLPPMVYEHDDAENELDDEESSLRRDVWDEELRIIPASDQLIAEVKSGNERAIEVARKTIRDLAAGDSGQILVVLRALRMFQEAIISGEVDVPLD
jgi:hypothetical protein